MKISKKITFSFEEICSIIFANFNGNQGSKDITFHLSKSKSGFTFLMSEFIPNEVIFGIIKSEINKAGESSDNFRVKVEGTNFVCEEIDDPTVANLVTITDSLATILQTPLEDLDLSKGTYNALKNRKINTLGDIVKHEFFELAKYRQIGKTRQSEIQALVRSKGLSFSMQV